MIGALDGIVLHKKIDSLVLMVNGVGYLVYPPVDLLTKISPGTNIKLFIHTYVREDALQLFGFAATDELELFEMLLAVSGIGPKTALSIINRGAIKVRQALTDADVAFFTSIPRLGSKNSQKLIIELKNKLGSVRDLDLKGNQNSQTKDLLEALIHFGFSKQEATGAIESIPETVTVFAEKIKTALKYLGSTK